MKDLELWRCCVAGETTAVAAMLRELAELSLRERAPFFGFVETILAESHETGGAELRAAAVSVLAGATGQAGVRLIVAALDDDDAEVRAAGVRALRGCATGSPERWAHAVFHGRADVRGLALDLEPPKAVEFYGAYLRADDDAENAAKAAGCPWPPNPVPLMLDLLLLGAPVQAEAAKGLGEIQPAQLRALLLQSYRRSPDEVRAALVAGLAGTPPNPGKGDLLDLWCRIYWAATEGRPAMIAALASATLSRRSLSERTALALIAAGSRHGHLPETLQLAAACDPNTLRHSYLPLAMRRQAALGLATHRKALRTIDPYLVYRLLDEGLPIGPGGELDLRLACLLVSFFGARAVAVLCERYGEAAVVDAAVAQEEAWPLICAMPESGPEWFAHKLSVRNRSAHASLIAIGLPLWLQRVPEKPVKDAPPPLFERIIAGLDSSSRVDVLVALGERARATDEPLKPKPLEKIVLALSKGIHKRNAVALLERLVPLSEPGSPEFAILERWCAEASPKPFTGIVAAMRESTLERLLELTNKGLVLRRDKELGLAAELTGHRSPAVLAWVEMILASGAGSEAGPTPTAQGIRALSHTDAEAIATAPWAELGKVLQPALAAPSTGLTAALARRPLDDKPSVDVVVALVGSHDPLAEVCEQVGRYAEDGRGYPDAVGTLVVSRWHHVKELGPLGHAWCHRWEQHGFALLAWMDGLKGGLAEALRLSCTDGLVPRLVLWEGIAAAVVLRRYRQPQMLKSWATAEALSLCVSELDTECGRFAAKILVAYHYTGFAKDHLARLRERAVFLAADMDKDTLHELSRWVHVQGLEARITPARVHVPKLRADRLLEIRNSKDLDMLAKLCARGGEPIANEAALRLVKLGAPGQQRLAALLREDTPLAGALAVAETVSMWLDDDSLAAARAVASNPAVTPQLRFRIATSLCAGGDEAWFATALEAAASPDEESWLTANDWDALVRFGGDPRAVAIALTTSVHPHAFQRAVSWLADKGGSGVEIVVALRSFLECGTGRPTYLRRIAARRLLQLGDPGGLLVAVAQVFDPEETSAAWLFDSVDAQTQILVAELAVAAAVIGGKEACTEPRSYELVSSKTLPTDRQDAAVRRLLLQCGDAAVREKIASHFGSAAGRDLKLGQIAGIFAWGVRRGRELTGRLFRVHMTARRQDLGYTRLTESTIFVSPLPVLKGERHGREIVEALVLHEFGHHMYHRSAESQRIWGKAQREGIGSILNLVADEHLERNLRAMEAEYGDRLKKLAAYAFQHSDREVKVARLLSMLLGSAFRVLTGKALGVAFDPHAVEVSGGQVLRELDRNGHGFARFVRAMRMGLGDRHEDPQLTLALSLFKGRFRHLDMQGLYEIAVKLSEIYGQSSDLASTFGGHESLEWDERGASVHGDGLVDDDVQQEVERILNPRKGPASSGPGRPGGRLQINVSGEGAFAEITRVEKVPADSAAHRVIAAEVRRHSERLKNYFNEIGLALEPRRARLRGRSFDRTRALAVVTRRDPRMLVARELVVNTDLFIGVVIDCSGSMATSRSMEKAHRFGVLLAEAARNLPGIDARFFGFTDRIIFDAGDDRSCAVTSLTPTGGNNDAAGLLYAAKVAANSPRRARLLVMISDGLPTECSVTALRSLVDQLTRRKGILCAQVAVRPLTEVCFPHYVELKDDELDTSVRRFGEIISTLAKRAIGR